MIQGKNSWDQCSWEPFLFPFHCAKSSLCEKSFYSTLFCHSQQELKQLLQLWWTYRGSRKWPPACSRTILPPGRGHVHSEKRENSLWHSSSRMLCSQSPREKVRIDFFSSVSIRIYCSLLSSLFWYGPFLKRTDLFLTSLEYFQQHSRGPFLLCTFTPGAALECEVEVCASSWWRKFSVVTGRAVGNTIRMSEQMTRLRLTWGSTVVKLYSLLICLKLYF